MFFPKPVEGGAAHGHPRIKAFELAGENLAWVRQHHRAVSFQPRGGDFGLSAGGDELVYRFLHDETTVAKFFGRAAIQANARGMHGKY